MNFQDAIKACFKKYADFNGRARCPNFGGLRYFALLVLLY